MTSLTVTDNAAMGKVIFLMNVSLDGYIETPDHSLDWTINDDELLAWFNERMSSFEAIVYGRRLYELMNAYWPTAESDPAATGPMVEFARISKHETEGRRVELHAGGTGRLAPHERRSGDDPRGAPAGLQRRPRDRRAGAVFPAFYLLETGECLTRRSRPDIRIYERPPFAVIIAD